MIQRVPVEVIGDHPHAGTRGYLEAVDGQLKLLTFQWDTVGMLEVQLENSPVEADSCFAERKHLKILGPPVRV